MKHFNFVLVKLCLALIAGILLAFTFEIPLKILSIATGLIFILWAFCYWRAQRQLFQNSIFGIFTYILFLVLGINLVKIHQPQNQPAHYLHKTESFSENNQVAQLVITERLKPNSFSFPYLAEVISISKNQGHFSKTQGKILLSIAKDSSKNLPEIGDLLLIPWQVQEIPGAMNPGTFSYKKYLESLQVFQQVKVIPTQILKTGKQTSIFSLAAGLREQIISQLKKKPFSKDEMAIIQALLLGQRQEVSSKINRNYIDAGVIHILAISGLHIGILVFIFNFIFKPLELLPKGILLKTLAMLFCLWAFAILAGLSPSILRAVSMFSFISIGLQINRRNSLLQSLFISLLFLLLLNPYYILQLGFQLSYLAVFGIALFQPLLKQLYQPKFGLDRYFWELLSVTLAAQIGVLPLSLYYFHQFPALFFIANLLILPFIGLLLGAGIVMLILAIFEVLPNFLAQAFGGLITFLNKIIETIAGQKQFLWDEIYLKPLGVAILYACMIGGLLFWEKKNFKYLVFIMGSFLIAQSIFIFEKWNPAQTEFVVFQQNKASILGFSKGKTLKIYKNDSTLSANPPFLKSYVEMTNIARLEREALKNVYAFEGKKILLVDASAIYELPGLQADIVVLTSSPKINLNRLLKQLHPQIIIADGSNYSSYIARWEKTCTRHNVNFYATPKSGAYRIEP